MSTDEISTTKGIGWIITGAGGVLGIMLSWGLLSGDAQGQVNVLHLLLIYLVIPVASAAISLLSLTCSKGLNLARLLASVPLWSGHSRNFFHWLRQRRLDKYWFFLHSQAAALAFSLASLAVFFLLLLATDVNFIWRSTLLTPESLLPLLRAVAAPWRFWHQAQPDLALLQATQDSRLLAVSGDVGVFYRWWPFILATQLCYSLLLRCVLLAGARIWLLRRDRRDIERQLLHSITRQPRHETGNVELAPVIDQIAGEFTLINWAGVDETLLQQLDEELLSRCHPLRAGPLATEVDQQQAERAPGPQLLIVKAWEPPMGELADYLHKTRGYLLPLDFDNGRLRPPRARHLEEWRRFVALCKGWQLYLPAGLQPLD